MSRLVELLGKLPGVGRKSAERLAQHLLDCPAEETRELATVLGGIRNAVRPCSNCFNLTESPVCRYCNDSRRDPQQLCIVEMPRDLQAIEAAGVFQGQYHVLGGRIAPLNGVHADDLRIKELMERVKRQNVREIVMATNPTLEGDGTALHISNLLAESSIKITRLARGIATGSVLEFANREMLADAIRGRQNW